MKEAKQPSPRLGRGLSDLLSDLKPLDESAEPQGAPPREMAVELLSPSPYQPRREFDADAMEDLARSVRAKGIIQPLLVRPKNDATSYEIIAGERRWRAAQMAGLHAVPVIVREISDTEAAEIALIENVQRADLNPVEEAAAYRDLIETFGHTQEKLSEAVGKSRSHIANSMRLLKLPSQVLGMISSGALSAGHARPLIGSSDPTRLAQEIVKRGLNVRQAERMVRNDRSLKVAHGNDARRRAPKDEDTRALEAELSANLRMGVRITHEAGSERGTLAINYYTLDDLDLLCRVLAAIPRDVQL